MLQDKLTKLTPEQLAKVEAYVNELIDGKPIEKLCRNCLHEDLPPYMLQCTDCDNYKNFTPKN